MKLTHFGVFPFLMLVACSSTSTPASNPGAPADAGTDTSTPAGPLDLPAQSDIDDLVKPLVDLGYVNGLVIGFVDATGQVVYGYGKTGTGDAPDGDTVYEIGSVTKTFTSLWLASQVGNGMTLDDPVSMYLPNGTVVPTHGGKAITVGELSTHTSGLPRLPTNLTPADPKNPYADYTVSDLYAFLGSYALTVDPGTSYTYSNVGAGLLGHALTLHAGSGTYEANVASVIGTPLGLVDTAMTLNDAQKARLAPGHDGDLGAAEAWTATNAIEGAGQLHSTAHDLLKLMAAEIGLGAGPLSDAIALTQTKHATDDLGRATGLGLTIESFGGIWNDGETGGYTSFIGFDPKKQRAVVMIADTACLYTGNVGITVLKRLEGSKVTLASAEIPPSVTLTDDTLGAFVGTYALSSGPMIVTLKNHTLWASGILDAPIGLYPSSAAGFALRQVSGSVVFTAQSATLSIDGQAAITGPKG